MKGKFSQQALVDFIGEATILACVQVKVLLTE